MPARSEPGSDSRGAGEDPVVLDWSPSGVLTTMWVALSIMLGILGLLLFGLFFALFGADQPDSGSAFNSPIVVALSALVLILHQLLHGAAARLSGATPRFDVDVVQLIFPVFYCRVTGQRFTRRAYLAYLLTPLGVLSVAGLIAMLLDPRGAMLIVPLALNSGMSTRDIWMAWVIWRQPNGVLVKTQADGFRVVRPGLPSTRDSAGH